MKRGAIVGLLVLGIWLFWRTYLACDGNHAGAFAHVLSADELEDACERMRLHWNLMHATTFACPGD